MPFSIGSGAPLAPHGPFSSAPYPDSFMGTHKDGAGQLLDQTLHSVMGFLWSRFLSGSWQALSGPVQRSDKTLPALAFSTQGGKKKKKKPPKTTAPRLVAQYAYEVDLLQRWT